MIKSILLILFIILGCTPQAPENSTGRKSGTSSFSNFWGSNNSSTTTNTTSTSSTHTFNAKWYFATDYYFLLTVDSSFKDIIYLRGSQVNQYLAQSSNYKNHCLKIKFGSSTMKPIVVKMSPATTYLSNGGTDKYFRANFNDVTGAMATCEDSNSVYKISESCPTCQGSLETTSIEIHTANFASKLSAQTINTSTLGLKINMNNNTNNNSGTCTNSICQANGYNCCLDGQCVNNGQVKTAAANANPTTFATIQQIVYLNPSRYADYPEYYYICASSVPTDPNTGGTSGTGSSGTNTQLTAAQLAFQKLLLDYQCISEMKEKTALMPFHENPINEEEQYEFCNIEDDSDELYYQTVLTRLYTKCGCSETELESMVANCPNYELKAKTVNSSGDPTEIVCYTPPVVVDEPFQNLAVAVNSRSAPHRFFSTEGEAIEKPGQYSGTEDISQEGDPFVYQDPSKTMPVNGSFNMNSILGQMTVNLDQALSATVVHVEYDDVYVIATTSGYYTACPSCARDSWFTPFSAYPSTSYGVGLQSSGYTTSRDTWGNNNSYGNYEDTIFGRACFIPPTMIPYSHAPADDTITQRLTRLATQSAYFINGYQRDWFGFNKGALIGSFDGVTWFAIGKGRIVKATSNRLFLAINAPFADLAEPTNHNVSVKLYEGISTGAVLDYNPALTDDHPSQNQAGSCQKNHQCETDKDCITTLGWEYVCGDVKSTYTQWPVFDSEANEIEAETRTVLIEQILQQGTLGSASAKRCIYRGAGAPCRKDYESISNENLRKNMACAPNFYCAGLEEEVYNNEIARFTGALENLPISNNHLFGKDANVLGRPLNYMATGVSTLAEEIIGSIAQNIQAMDAEAEGNEGICRPGKAVVASEEELVSPGEQHQTADEELRTDFISQIGGCNSSLTIAQKYLSCPVLNEDGNYVYTSDTFLDEYGSDAEASIANLTELAKSQNSCGGETLSGEEVNPFANIESETLTNTNVILNPTLVKDACLRRAGAVCHTDLDCSPNKFHSETSQLYSESYFGNVAEQKYYEEYLVCGQAENKPTQYDANFKTYKMNKNVCCREIGKDITIYSEKTPNLAETENLNTQNFSFLAPADESRYSRFAVSTRMESAISGSTEKSGKDLSDEANLLTKNQWKAIGDVGAKTCCGGGWVRKFADGSHNWAQTGRLSFDVTNFRCINFKSPLVTATTITEYTSLTAYNREYSLFCSGTGSNEGENGCMESGVKSSDDDYKAIAPVLSSGSQSIEIRTDDKFKGTEWAPYRPISADPVTLTYFDHSKVGGGSGGDSAPKNTDGEMTLFIPAYMGIGSITKVKIESVEEGISPWGGECQESPFDSCNPTAGKCNFCIDQAAGKLKIVYNESEIDGNDTYKGKDYTLKITFDAPGSDVSMSEAGNYLYYLYKMGRLELAGIPQIHYEPIVCTNDSNKLVPGLYKDSLKTYDNLVSSELSFSAEGVMSADATNPDNLALPAAGLKQPEVFSPNEFSCCRQLGTETANAGLCCSGYAVENKTTKKLECKLPKGANLNVYYNRFVTSEGQGATAPGGGLNEDSDFDENTGEPKATDAIYKKLNALGKAYCYSGKTRRGAAFGIFTPEPKSGAGTTGSKPTIVDSYLDAGTSASSTQDGGAAASGYTPFYQGFRWNHHIYCE